MSQERKQRMSKQGERLSLSLTPGSLQPNYLETDGPQSPTSVQPSQDGDWSLPNPLTSRLRRDTTIASVRLVQREELTQNDVIIAVMGPTGAGKSTFIQTVTGRDNGVGHSLESCTSQVSAVRVTFSDGVSVVLVDTPGFDDTHLSDLEVLKIIAQWLKEVRQDKFGFSGILYLHRISDNRMAGTPLKNLAMFKKLCGEDFFKRVILTTTMWPKDDDREYDLCLRREGELRKEYWAEMIDRGSKTLRFENTKSSAGNVLDQIIVAESSRRLDALTQALRIQQELVDEKKKIPRTEAGQQLHGLIEDLVVKQNDVLKRLKDELGKTADPKIIEALLEELGQLRRERENAIKDKRQLELSLLAKMRRAFGFMRVPGARKLQTGRHPQESREGSHVPADSPNHPHPDPLVDPSPPSAPPAETSGQDPSPSSVDSRRNMGSPTETPAGDVVPPAAEDSEHGADPPLTESLGQDVASPLAKIPGQDDVPPPTDGLGQDAAPPLAGTPARGAVFSSPENSGQNTIPPPADSDETPHQKPTSLVTK